MKKLLLRVYFSDECSPDGVVTSHCCIQFLSVSMHLVGPQLAAHTSAACGATQPVYHEASQSAYVQQESSAAG